MFYAYVLRSDLDGTLYKGHTQNLDIRLFEHNSGKSKYTKTKLPWKIVYFEENESRNEAIKREKYFKSAAGRRFISKILD